jgi:hypothetical protein
MHAASDFHIDGSLEYLGIALAIEALEPALAVLIGVADDPRVAARAVAVSPGALAD